MERWLLISNCQTTGLANSFQLLNRNFDVTGLDIWGYLLDPERWNAEMGDYFRVVVSPEIEQWIPGGLPDAPNLTRVPALSFAGYHPDLCYIWSPEGNLKGPLGVYHSLIAFAAWQKGMSEADTVALFNAQTYEKCGYFDFWGPQRDALLAYFKMYGLDISEPFARWGRKGAFMHSTDHPKVDVIYDVAKTLLITGGVEYQESWVRPVDVMVNGPCWPVYPEIGEVLGVEGSYNFKRDGMFRHTHLAGFVHECFAAYARHPRESMSPVGNYKAMYDHVSGQI